MDRSRCNPRETNEIFVFRKGRVPKTCTTRTVVLRKDHRGRIRGETDRAKVNRDPRVESTTKEVLQEDLKGLIRSNKVKWGKMLVE